MPTLSPPKVKTVFKTIEEVRSEDLSAPPPKKKWRLEDSIFAKKPKENDSMGFW